MGVRPWMKTRLAVGATICSALLVSCDSGCPQSQPVPPQRVLTAEDARGALVELLRGNPTAFQRRFDADDLAKQPLTSEAPGSYLCGGFRIEVAAARYQITVRYGCVFEYEGTFDLQNGRWVASKPHWTSAALVKDGPP